MSPRKDTPKAPNDPAKAGSEKTGRIAQFRLAYSRTREVDPRVGWILLGTFVAAGVVAAVVFQLLLGHLIGSIVFGILVGLLVVLIIFGRRAQSAAMKQIEGKPGAGIAALGMLRRGWKVEPQPIAFNKQQDVVTRVVGPPGIVLIGEGNPNRLRPLMAAETKKHARAASEVPIHEVLIGDGEGQVPIRKLLKHVRKLGRDLKPAQMTDVLNRLKALDSQRSNIPLPKGPVPTSMKGLRQNMRGR